MFWYTSRTMSAEDTFVSECLWHEDNEHVLVVACPDPRFREARGEFIAARYDIRRYDPLIVPGGPQSILDEASHSGATREMIKLLNTAHGFQRVIGISHYDCRAYREAFPLLTEGERRVRQIEDLRSFEAEIERLVPGAPVEVYYCEPYEGRIRFTRIRPPDVER
jgi:hypothetical protein